MAKKLRFLFTLLFVMAATLSWGEDRYVKVTSIGDVTEGQYLIVCESKKVAITGSGTTKDNIPVGTSVSINNNSITATTEIDKISVLISGSTDNYFLKTQSGYYFYHTNTTSNGFSVTRNSSTAREAKITFDNDNNVNIISSGYLRYNSSTSKFNFFKPSTYTAQTAIQLYKRVSDVAAKTDIAILNSISPTIVNVGDINDFALDATFAEGTVAGTDYTVSWESSNTDVLDVVGGTYEAKAAGTANVTVKVTPTDTESYNEVSKSFEVTIIPAPFENIAKLTEQTASGTYKVQLNNAVVTYVNGNYAYIQDESGAIVLYKSGHGFTAGQILNGTAEVTFQIRNANPQITSITGYTATEGADPEPTVITASEWNTGIATVLSQWFKITGATITSESDKYYVQLGNETVQLYGQGEARTISVNDLTAKYTIIGFPTMYNSTPELQIFVQPEVETYNITAVSNNEAWGTVSLEGTVITANPKAGYRVALENSFVVTSGIANVSQDGNVFSVNAESDCSVMINFEDIPTHTVTFSVNGENTQQTFAEGSNITFDTPADVLGKSFVGWTTAAIDGTTNVKPELVALGTMGTTDVTYYAVFANVTPGTSTEVTDVLTRATTGVKEEATYSVWSGKTVTSSAVYAGQSAGDNNSIQLRSNNSNSGIITTTSGGKVKKVSVEWNSNTTSGRTLDVYGSNTAYTAATDLYNSAKQGTKLGSIVYGTSAELSITGDYTYIGLRSYSGAMYLDNISITWENGTPATYSDYCTTLVLPAPTFSPEAGVVDAGTEVTITAVENAKMVYTIGENMTTTEGNTATIIINETTTITAKAIMDNMESEEVTATYTIAPAVEISAPVVFHDSGEYEAGLSVPMYAQAGAKIYYTTDGSEPTTASTEYTGALTIEKATTVKAIAVLDGVASAVVTREYTIKAAAAEIEAIDGYYSIKNNDNEKYINVAGRKTVTFVADGDEADKAGTVLKVKINTKGQVEELRSQGVDLPGYADRAMNYVPKFVKLIVDKLHAEGSGKILGEHGLDAIMQKFNESFDYHLYIENVNDNANANGNAGYRIYGKTPSMKPVVDFYAENKDNVDYKLPQLEAFINSAIQKVLQKTGGRGASILTEFKLHDIWQKMGETLTEPVKDDAASIAKFYEEVLASEANVWNFAYQTAMTYWNNVKSHPRYEELKGKLGEYANYIEKVENIRPDFKYYIVANTAGNDVDFISEGNADIQSNATRAIWTMNERNNFAVKFTKENSLNIGRELYTTLYVDFAYTLPETVKAYKVTAIDEKTGLATKEEITGVIPAQTPVLLQMIVDPKTVTDADLTQTLTLSTEAGSAVAGNLLQGPEWLINKYSITAKQVEDLFGYVHDFLKLADVEALYDSYVKEYEYLMIRNAGTVNNKYFFGLSGDDIADADVNVCQLAKQGNTRKRLAFYHNLEKVDANKAFIPSEKVEPVYLSLIGDVNRDGYVNITDVTCQIDIVLGKDKPEDNYDYDAADLDGNDEIRIDDVTDLIDVVLGKKTIE